MSSGDDVSQPGSRGTIHYSTVLVVEGLDAFWCFLSFLRELGLQNQVEVRNGGGVPYLYDYLAVLPNLSGFDAVTSLGVICDCETDPAASFRDLCSALQRAGLAVPTAPRQPTASSPGPRVQVALLPDDTTPGMLETLLWRSLAGHALVPCVDQLLACVLQQTGQPHPREEKARVYSYIASREQPWLLLGQAARAGYFPWTSPVFDEIKMFLQGL